MQRFDDPLRDIQVSDALTLTKINPAYMTRQLGEIAAEAAEVVTISVGVVSARGGEMSAETLMRRADEAMYRAKEAGRNRVVVDREAVLESLSSRGSTRSGGRSMTLPLTAPDASSEAPG